MERWEANLLSCTNCSHTNAKRGHMLAAQRPRSPDGAGTAVDSPRPPVTATFGHSESDDQDWSEHFNVWPGCDPNEPSKR